MEVDLRQENKDDYPAVFELNKAAFGQDNEARLVDLLRKSAAFIPELSLVATIDGQVTGHILFSKIKIRESIGKETESLALAPMAVTPQFQNQGIGAKLIRFGLKKATELGYESVIVLGHQYYYPKFGFFPANKWNINAPFDVPENVFMAIELVKDGLKNVTGTVQYAAEFEMV